MFKTYSIGFDEIIIKFTDQNGRPLEIEHKFILILLINKKKRHDVLYNQEQENMLKDMDLCHPSNKYGKQLLRTRLDILKTVSKKSSH